MSRFHRPPAFRTFRARVKALKRPLVWGTASVLSLVTFFLVRYWQTPQWISLHAPNFPASRFSASDSTIADLGIADLPMMDALVTGPATAHSTDALSSSPFAGISFAATTDSIEPDQPISLQTPRVQNSGNADSSRGNPLPSSLDSALLLAETSEDSDSPLQSALDRRSTPNPLQPSLLAQTSSQSSLPPSSELTAVPGINRLYVPQPLPGSPLRDQTLLQPQFVPQTSPSPGTTGYTLPPSLRLNTTSLGVDWHPDRSWQLPQHPLRTVPSPRVIPSPSLDRTRSDRPLPQGQDNLIPAPFSVPFAAPGQSIGGGQIHTFSNP